MIKVLYFARLKDTLDCGEEQIEADASLATAADLLAQLCARGEPWNNTLGDNRNLVAINQEVSSLDSAINDGDEVAFFPPVTGG